MKIIPRACAIALFLFGTLTAPAQTTPIVIPNGGASGLGSIYLFDPATAKLTPPYEFTTKVPGRNPVELISSEWGHIFGITEYGGKYNSGTIFKVDRETEECITLFENPYHQYKFNSLFFIGSQLYARAKELGKDGEKVFKINSTGDVSLDSSIPMATRGGPDSKLLANGESYTSYLPYRDGFVGLGSITEYGPADNPWVMPKGTFLFKWSPPETKITKLQSWDNPEISNIALNRDIAFYTLKGETGIQTYDLSSTTMTTLPVDEDHTPTNMLAWDSTIWGLTSSSKLMGYSLKTKSVWTDATQLVNPRELKLGANNNLYIHCYGDLGNYPGSVMVFNLKTKLMKPLVAFDLGEGREPLTSMVKLGENYYGAVKSGGSGMGNLFSLDKNLKQKTLFTFGNKTGRSLVQLVAHGDRIFGISKFGGREDAGVLFSYQPQNEEFKILYEFQERGPRAPVGMLDVNNSLYIACFDRDVVVYNIDQNNTRVVSSDKWSRASDLMYDGKEIFILARARGAKQDSWLRFSEGDGLPPVPQFPTQKTIYISGTGYYLDKGKLYKWKAGAPPSILIEYPITNLNANLSVSGDYLLISTFPDYAHTRPDGTSIYAYNVKTAKSQTLLKGKDLVPPAVKSAASDKLPSTFVIDGTGIWVRDVPTTGKVVMKLNDGDVCQVLEKGKYQEIRGVKNFWYKIKFKNQVGWVFGSQGRFENLKLIIKD